MRILVCSRISIPATGKTIPDWDVLRGLGHSVTVGLSTAVEAAKDQQPLDAIISMGVTVMDETLQAMKQFPHTPVFCYNWDCYEWVWKPGFEGRIQSHHASRKNEYDYVRYGELLHRAIRSGGRVWVPSHCTGLRTAQWWGISWDHIDIILSSCPYWDPPRVTDGGYALCCLREIPDPWWGVFERCCAELGIPYMLPRHELSYQAYQDVVAGARFLVSPLYELSTGGLSLMEGYYLGKRVLLSNSPWNGGRDYFGARATYFRHGDEADFKAKLHEMIVNPQAYPAAPDHKEWVVTNFSDTEMVNSMLTSIRDTVRNMED